MYVHVYTSNIYISIRIRFWYSGSRIRLKVKKRKLINNKACMPFGSGIPNSTLGAGVISGLYKHNDDNHKIYDYHLMIKELLNNLT